MFFSKTKYDLIYLFIHRVLEIIEEFSEDFIIPDHRNFTFALRNLLLNIRVTTKNEEQNGVYFQPESQKEKEVRVKK